MCVCVVLLQTPTDRGAGGQDSFDASDAGGARPKVIEHATSFYSFVVR